MLVLFWLGAIVGIVLVPLLVGDAVNKISADDRSGLVLSALAIGGVAIVVAASQGARQRVAGRVGLRLEYDLRNRFFAHLHSLDLRVLQSESVGQLVSRATVDMRQIPRFLGWGLSALAQDVGTVLLAAVVMFALDADLAALALSPLPLIIAMAILYQRAAVPFARTRFAAASGAWRCLRRRTSAASGLSVPSLASAAPSSTSSAKRIQRRRRRCGPLGSRRSIRRRWSFFRPRA